MTKHTYEIPTANIMLVVMTEWSLKFWNKMGIFTLAMSLQHSTGSEKKQLRASAWEGRSKIVFITRQHDPVGRKS